MRELEKAPYQGTIVDKRKKINDELETIRMYKRARRGSQNMAIANRQAEEIYHNLNDTIEKEMFHEAKNAIDNKVSKVEKDYNTKKDTEEILKEKEQEKKEESQDIDNNDDNNNNSIKQEE